MRKRASRCLPVVLAGAALFLATSPVHAQTSGGVGSSSSGTSPGGGLTGSSGSSSSGGSLLGSSPAGGFTGSSSTSRTGGANSSSTTPGSTSVLGPKLGSALATAYPGSTVAASYGSTSATPWYNTDIPYGTAMYNITSASGTVSTSGFASAGLSNSSSVTVATGRFGGANSYGIRRNPGYTTGIAFDYTPRPVAEVRPDLEQVLNSSSRLPSGANIRVVMDGKTIVLRGRVATERERRLAEAIVRLTPGVRDVRNEIETPTAKKEEGGP